MITLTNAEIKFFTPNNTNDKDHDTAITVTVYTANRAQTAAEKIDFAGINTTFPDNDTFSPDYALNVRPNINKENLGHGSFDVTITPNGNDTWVFIAFLKLTFSDGSVLNYNAFPTRVVDQNGRSTSLIF